MLVPKEEKHDTHRLFSENAGGHCLPGVLLTLLESVLSKQNISLST